jgi:hypothetical protein
MLNDISQCLRLAIRGVVPKTGLCLSFPIILPLLLYNNEALSANVLGLEVGEKYEYDDNLLKMPNERGEKNIQSDYSWSQNIVFGIDKQYSRQRFVIVADFERVTFRRLSKLSYIGHNTDLSWLWQSGNDLTGVVGTSDVLQLPSYADVDTDQRNLRKTTSTYATAVWTLHPKVIATARYRKNKYEYELLSQQYNNHDEYYRGIELEYISRSGSTIGIEVRRLSAKNFPQLGGMLAPGQENFKQTDVRLRIDWYLTGKTKVDALLGSTSRTQQHRQAETNSGITGRVHIAHAARTKLRLDASIWREFAPLESSQATYSLNRGINIGAAWELTNKLTITADTVFERRLYVARAADQASSDIRDYTKTNRLTLKWAPRSSFSLVAQLNHQDRTGTNTLTKTNFKANSISLFAKFSLK